MGEQPTISDDTRVTADEFLARAHAFVRAELVDGTVVEAGPAAWMHGVVRARVSSLLSDHTHRTDTGIVVAGGVGYRLGEQDVRAPDVSVHLEPPGDDEVFPATMPALVAEVISPSEAWTDVETKVARYLEAGVREVWLVDPSHETVTSRRPDGAVRVFRVADTLETDVLPGFSSPLERVFR
ncbi:MAG: Uma2 family endonuclease [Myxococcota bacterium]